MPPKSDKNKPSKKQSSAKKEASAKDSSNKKDSSSKKSPAPNEKASSSSRSNMQAQKVAAAGASTMHSSKLKPMTRPAYGKAGRSVHLETNFFRMAVPRKLVVSQYSISIWRKKEPDSDRRHKRGGASSSADRDGKKVWTDVSSSEPIAYNRAVFEQICEKHGRSFGCSLAYDGRSIAYAPREVDRSCLGVMYKIAVNREGGRPTSQETRDGKAEEVQVKIEHAKYLKYDELLASRLEPSSTTSFLSGLDVVLGSTAMKRYVQIGRSFYSDDRSKPLGRFNVTASAWRGFYQSARLSQLGLVVNLDESFTAFWNRGGKPLMDLIKDANDNRLISCDDSRGLRKLTMTLRGLKVRATHTGIKYTVHGFSSKGADRILFDSLQEKRRVSISEYFANHYNIRLRHGGLPCVKTNPKRDTYLPLELLTVVESQRVTGVLSPDQTMSIVRIASSRPDARKEAALKTMQRLNHSSDRVCREFGVTVDRNLIKVDGRVLPTPMIHYKSGPVKPAQGEWKAPSQNRFPAPAELNSWAVINTTDLRPNELDQFLKDLLVAANRGGMKIGNPRPPVFRTRQDRVADEMRKVGHLFRQDKKLCIKGWGLQLIVIIKQKKDAVTYGQIKRVGDSELGVASQVLLQIHCSSKARGRSMYCDNVILKINSKLGGQNAYVAPFAADRSANVPDVAFVNIPHMILGADVTHPVANSRSPSVAALVGSRDRQCVQYSASLRNQTGRKEVINEIGEMFKEVYELWRKNFNNSVHVQTLIMFRDGVSDGQFEEVMQVELAAIRKACTQISSECRPRITYIIVTKRHHARFFSNRPNVDRSGNILPGTVVDRDITSREYYDFYINSHAGIQGTSKPSKYTVLIDENKIPVDALQGYIFRLAHGFVRCNRSVSMVNSAYYAHLLAFRGRAYLGEDGSDTSSAASSDNFIPPVTRIHPVLTRRLFFV